MKWKCVIFMCYSSEKLITLITLHEVVPTWYSFHSWVDWSNADKVSCSRRKHTDAGVRTVTSVSQIDILTTRPICIYIYCWGETKTTLSDGKCWLLPPGIVEIDVADRGSCLPQNLVELYQFLWTIGVGLRMSTLDSNVAVQSQHQYVFSLSKRLYPHCFSRLSCEMSTRWGQPREGCSVLWALRRNST